MYVLVYSGQKDTLFTGYTLPGNLCYFYVSTYVQSSDMHIY